MPTGISVQLLKEASHGLTAWLCWHSTLSQFLFLVFSSASFFLSYPPCWHPGSLSAPAGKWLCPYSDHSSRWTFGHISWVWLSSSSTSWKALVPSCWCLDYHCYPTGQSTSAPPSLLKCDWGQAPQTWVDTTGNRNWKRKSDGNSSKSNVRAELLLGHSPHQ